MFSNICRLQQEVDHCRKQQPYEIQAGSRQDRLAIAMEQAETLNDAAVLEAQDQLTAAAKTMDVDVAVAGESVDATGESSSSCDQQCGVLRAQPLPPGHGRGDGLCVPGAQPPLLATGGCK